MKDDRLYVAFVGLRSPWGTEGGVEAPTRRDPRETISTHGQGDEAT